MRILVYGYGNPGRQDDGLGIALVDRLEAWAADEKLTGISFENNYQLNIEDAEAISDQDLVVFADASEEDIEDYCLSEVDGTGKMSFTTHAASPSYVVKLCQELFDRTPRVLLLHIKGYAWNFQEGLTDPALKNLDLAFDGMKAILKNPQTALDSKEEMKLC